MIAALQLERFCLERISVRANPGFDAENSDSDLKIPLGVDFEVRKKPKSWEFRIPMKVVINPGNRKTMVGPYAIEFEMVGFFRLPSETTAEEVQKFIPLNALAILWGVARGLVHQFTSAGPHGPLLLPTVNFVEIVNRKFRETSQQEKIQKPKKVIRNGQQRKK